MNIFDDLWSWSFLAGLVLGFVLVRTWQLLHTCWLDKHRPLPDGKRRSKWAALAVDPRILGATVAVAFLGWSVLQTNANAADQERTATEATQQSKRTNACFEQLIVAIVESRKFMAENDRISAQNDELSREERALLADLARYQAEWLGRILDPPPEVDRLDRADPIRERYVLDVTRGFLNRAGEVNKRTDAIHVEQEQNERSRPRDRPALPDPKCD